MKAKGEPAGVSRRYRNVREILVISLTCIGDVLLTTPVISNLKAAFPGARVTVLAGKTAYPLLAEHEPADRALVFDNRGAHRGWRGVMRLSGELRRERYDMVVDLRNTVIPYFLRARYRITAHGTHLRHRDVRGRHAIDRHLDVLADHGIPVRHREMTLTPPREASSRVEAMLRREGLLNGRALIAVYPGAGSPYKEYPAEKFAAV
ncbi:MAG: hypothetical protein AB1742_00405, partial [bacterium]